MTSHRTPPVALGQQIPEPSNLWTDASVRWPGRRDVSWIDLRSRDLGGVSQPTGPRWRSRSSPQSVYIPPLAQDLVVQAGELVTWCVSSDVRIVEHIIVGLSDAGEARTVDRVFDLLDSLLEGDWARLESIPPGALLSWPLVPGLSDTEELLSRGLERLSQLSPLAVVPTVPELTPAARRALSERYGGEAFEAVFHPHPPDPRAFAGRCLDRGIDFLPRRARPVGRAAGARDLQRTIADELGLIADLRREAESSAAGAQSFYGAARWFESTAHDVRSLLREGNLDIIPWVDREIASVAEDLASGKERSELLIRVARRYARRG